jgi:hypothetical protein
MIVAGFGIRLGSRTAQQVDVGDLVAVSDQRFSDEDVFHAATSFAAV